MLWSARGACRGIQACLRCRCHSIQSHGTAGHATLTCVPSGIDLTVPPTLVVDDTGGSLRVSAVEFSGRVQMYPGLFEVSMSLNAVVRDRWARYIDLRTVRHRSDRATHPSLGTALAGACG